MFTGIIETMAIVEAMEKEGGNIHFTFSCKIAPELKIDQSVAHNGVCLTVTSVSEKNYTVTAIGETLSRSNLAQLVPGDLVNIERCMPVNGRFDGHIVQGHVDTTAICRSVSELQGSWEFIFRFDNDAPHITVEKGSITVNGVSLTVVKSEDRRFSVHVIPYTFEHTNFRLIRPESTVNIEFDIIGKYVAKMLSLRDGRLPE